MKLSAPPDFLPLYNEVKLDFHFPKSEQQKVWQLRESIGEIDPNKDYEIIIRVKRKKRSLDANGYYYALVGKCAEKLNTTITELHNKNLANLGIPWRSEDGKIHWILQADNDFWLEQKETHFCPTDRTENRNGVTYRWFYLLKPSHLFDTKEMSRLIDAVVQDCKALQIETLPPDELEHLKEMWR